jgi:1-acyl-sn-glycerol-3-phosphate acyltransferase
MRLLDRIGASIQLDRVGKPSRAGELFLRFLVRPYVTLAHGPRITGLERLQPGPCLIVANHSGGGMADTLCLASVLYQRFGTGRAITAMAHPVAFFLPVSASVLRAFGAIPSTRDAALAALEKGNSVIVFPGGDHEAFRPFWEANVVDFAARQGFLRLARSAWVPIVPLGIKGAHRPVPILWRSKVLPWLAVLPRAVGIKRLPVTVLWLAGIVFLFAWVAPRYGYALAGALAFAWSANPVPYVLPLLPWPVRLSLGEPIPPERLFPSRGDDGPLDAAYEQVRSAVQALVTAGMS